MRHRHDDRRRIAAGHTRDEVDAGRQIAGHEQFRHLQRRHAFGRLELDRLLEQPFGQRSDRKKLANRPPVDPEIRHEHHGAAALPHVAIERPHIDQTSPPFCGFETQRLILQSAANERFAAFRPRAQSALQHQNIAEPHLPIPISCHHSPS